MSLRIGGYSGFWGDSIHAARQLVDAEKDNLDILIADYLAEVTMGLLARRSRHAAKGKAKPGYVEEIIPLVLEDLLPKLIKYKIKLVCNAGGLDPVGLKAAIEAFAEKKGLAKDVSVAAVYGDDIHDSLPTLQKKAGALTGFSPFGDAEGKRVESLQTKGKVLSVNAYVGAEGIRHALSKGANIVVTGRCADSALVLGPCLNHFGWNLEQDLDRVASASLAGHIIECGAQATGGNFTDWREGAFSKFGGWANVGYGIVEMSQDGSFVVTKPKNTGGVATRLSVGEQMLYEVLDPGNYLLPDVTLDLTRVTLEQVGPERVLVKGAIGKPPSEYLKCTVISADGYTITGQLGIVGEEAREKALALGQALLQRVGAVLAMRKMEPWTETRVEAIGSEEMFGKHRVAAVAREVIMRVQASHPNPLALRLLAMEFAYSATSTAPAITGGGSGRPSPAPMFSTTSFLLHKKHLSMYVSVGSEEAVTVQHATKHARPTLPTPRVSFSSSNKGAHSGKPIKLIKLAVGRSGDKGDNANVAFMARKPEYYDLLREQLTEDVIRDTLGHLMTSTSDVQRYDLPGSSAVNFVISNCLGGGGLRSLRFDKQAKSYAQICLSVIHVNVPESANL